MQGTLVAPALLESLELREEPVKLLGPLCQCPLISMWRGGLRLQCIFQIMQDSSTLGHFNVSFKAWDAISCECCDAGNTGGTGATGETGLTGETGEARHSPPPQKQG